MKDNAHLYWPLSVIKEYMVLQSAHLPEVKPDRRTVPVVSVEQLDGGCALYRLTPVNPN
jgi:hypothetical protein